MHFTKFLLSHRIERQEYSYNKRNTHRQPYSETKIPPFQPMSIKFPT
uniref:Uncharacterized protein n=1 Tax=Rhizophora mucronata TaxID=61149 RepID=A0A2P2PC44_RHIMU